MSSCNCFICGNELGSEKTIINKKPVCLRCMSEADPDNSFKMVKDIISLYNEKKSRKKKK